MTQILEYLNGRPAIMAGDFNSQRPDGAIQQTMNSDQFRGYEQENLTFPASQPVMQIDFIFVPKKWQLIDQHVVNSDASDHLPIVATYQVE
jgi:endonuclease/exonuclease/phosphatase (EEP) superfamily protein YafD